jgi:iron(III) transport system permease protein
MATQQPAVWRRAPFALRWHVRGRTLAIAGVVLVLVYLVIGPLGMLLLSSFKATNDALPFSKGVPWTLDNFSHVLLSGATYKVLLTTFVFAGGSLAFSFALALTLAWLIERTDLPFRNGFYVIIVASLGMPQVIAAIAWALLGDPLNGILNIPLRGLFDLQGRGPINVFSVPGLIFVQGLTLVPITFLLVTAAFRGMNVTMEDAARASGARFRVVLRRITLPMLAPALLSALIYQFVTVIESFDIPLVIGLRGGIRVLSTQIYLQAEPAAGLPNYGLSSAYSIILLLLALGPLLFYNWMISRSERYATITGQDFRPQRMPLGRWKVPAVSLAVLFVVLLFVLPALVMVWTSLQPFYSVPSAESLKRITFSAFGTVLGGVAMRRAFFNTLLVGSVTAAATMLLGLFVSWILVRSRSRAKVALDVLAFVPHAMPGVIIGLSILLIYLVLPVPVFGTPWVIIIALSTQYVSLSTRLMTGGIVQVQRQLEEAAEASGASWGPTLRRIVLPIVMPTFINGFLLVFLNAIRNLTLALVLYTPASIVLSTLVYRYWDHADTAETAVVGVIMVAITLTLSVLLRRFNAFGGGGVARTAEGVGRGAAG